MKQIAFVIIVLLLCGCSTPAKQTWIPPDSMTQRANPLFYRVTDCIKLHEDGKTVRISIVPGSSPNAMVDGDGNVSVNRGIFDYDDTVVAWTVAHELSHIKLNHVRNRNIVSYTTTGIMTAIGFVIPFAGYLNYAVNPAVSNNFNKFQEYDADKMASDALVKCFGISIDHQVQSLDTAFKNGSNGGGFWAQHPSWDDRIANIRKLQPSASTPANNH